MTTTAIKARKLRTAFNIFVMVSRGSVESGTPLRLGKLPPKAARAVDAYVIETIPAQAADRPKFCSTCFIERSGRGNRHSDLSMRGLHASHSGAVHATSD